MIDSLCSFWGRFSHDDVKCYVLLFRPEVIKLFSSSAQLSMKFQLLINVEIAKISGTFRFKTQKLVILFILLINVKMPTIVGILTFMSRINFSLN